MGEFAGDLFKTGGELDIFRAGHQQSERHGLGVAVGEGLVVRLGEEKLAPIRRQRSERCTFQSQLLGHFIPQQPAEAGADASQFFGVARRNGFPTEESLEQAQQARRRLKFVARRFDVSDQREHRIHQLPVLPKAERIPIRVDQIGKRVEFLPLRFVMRVFELPWIGALARRFQFNESHQRLVNGNGVVGARLQVADRGFAHGSDSGLGEAGKLRQVREQLLEWRAELVLRFALRAWIGQLGFGFGSEGGDGRLNSEYHSSSVTIGSGF